ncbi:hypothetical protein B5O31_19540 [Salmonella enterica]|nr:hypothetical protein [Salmonella enterica]
MPGIMTGLFIGVYMAYQPEIMRPELQRANDNRNGLNIQQPGENDWATDFFSNPENAVDRSKSFGLGDVLPSVGVGAAQSVQGTGELARGLGDGLVNSPVKTAARIENELLKLWSPGVSTINDIIPGTGKSVDETIDALPDGKNAVTDAIGKGLKVTGKGVSDVAGATKDWSYDKMSPGAQRALNTPMSEGWEDSAVWVAKGTNLIGSLLPDLAAGGLTKKVGEVALKKALTSGLEKKFIASGLAPEKAGILAAKAVEEKMPDLFQAGMVTSSTTSAQGSTAMNAAQSILNADYSELSKSPKFQEAFYAIDDDPQYAELSDRQKMDMAKERVADEVRTQLATDPQSLIVNALSAKLGDAQLVNLALRGTAKSVTSGIARNMAEQAGINAAQGGFSRYQENAALRDTAGMDVPEWQGVGEAAFESGVMGSALGAPFGAIAGHRGKRQAEAGINARKDASRQAMDEKAARAQQMAENSPHTKPVDPVESYRQQFSGLSRDELLQHYADADLAPENDVDAVYRKHAANALLKEMDRADQLKGVVDEMQGKPRNEVLKEYRDLNEKDKRNETEQMRWEAARQVLKPQPKAPTEQPQPAQNTSSENTARRPLYDADNLDVPAFMRDPRFRDFTDEPTEVQQHLTRGNAPTPEELVHEQMTKGDAGPTEYEMAERPRLPPPGDIHPGQGYPLPGDVRHLPDESPAGRGGRYTTTGEVRGQSYEKGRQTVAPEGVQRQGETLQSEQEYRELPAPERQGLPRPEEPGHTSHEQGGMAAREPRDSEQNLLQKPEKAGQQQSATEKSGEKIDDFGEVIHGAAKHRRAALAESMKEEKTAEDYHTQPFSKLFPKPDYEKMAGEGTDNKTLAMLALLRNMIPAKPRVPHRLNRWAKQVEEVRDTAGQLLDGSLPADKFIDRIRKEKGSHYSEIVNTWEMLHRLSPAQLEQAAGYRVKTHAYSMFRGEQYNPPKVVHSLENEKGRSILDSEDLKDLNKKAKAYFDQQAASPEPADSKTKLDIYQNRRTGEIFIAYGKNKTSLQGGFKTVAEARDYAKTRRAELLEKLNKLREQSREEQRNASNRDRNGPVRRGGEMHTDVNALRNISGSGAGYSEKAASLKRKIAARMNTNDAFAFNRLMDSRFANERERGIAIAERVAATLEPEQNVTPEKFSDAFGFRGVQFGNYVEGPRRQSDLNRAYDSLMDMADVLKVPAKALSLNGRLGLAFGARGKGGKNAAAAHYEPDAVAINLTKGNGAGSLAHEWFHALDNYFGQYDVAKDSDVGSGGEYMTERHRKVRQRDGNTYVTIEHPVRQEVYDAFKGVMKAIKESSLPERSLRLDDVRSKPYWSTDIEMAARAFERYVQDKAKSAGVENDFLVNIRKADDHGSPDTYAYPTNEELDGGIRQAFDHLFSTLKTRETDKGVAFYSLKGVKRTPEGNFISDTSHSKEAKGSSVAKVKAVARGVMDRIKDNTLNVRVVKSQAEAQELAGESFDGYGKVHAFYRPDEHEIVLVADNIPDGRTVREKLRHEIIHHAMEQVVTPAEYKTIVDNVLKTRNSDNAAIRETWRKVDADYGNESPEVQAGEFLAHMAEKEPGKLGAAWNRVVALIKAVLRRTGLFQPSDLNDIGYVRDTIRTLGQRVREGYVPREGGDVSYSRTGKPDPFRVPEGEGERYRRDLAKMMKSLRSTDMTVDIGRTPPVLRHIGAPDLPLVISRDVIRKATNGVKHDVPMDVIERLPELMHDPEAVYQSATEKNAVVVLLNATDMHGDPVVTAVQMKAIRSRMEINRIASVYGTKGGMNKANSMDKAGLTLYRKEKLSRDNPLHRGLQLPEGEHSYHGSENNVLSPDDIRKGPYYSRSRSALSPEETLAARFVRRVQDKFQVLKAVQDNIRNSGGKLDDSNNAYLAEELFHGKAENDLNVMTERYAKPLANLLAQYDIPQSALDEYLYARHAPERNLHIAKINPKMPDGGSGMTNAEAAGIMDKVRRSGKQAQYDRLAGIVDDMLARRRELIKSAGLESEGTVDAWQDTYKHYVPLKGQDADGALPRTGRGYVVSGKESKMAMGRKSKAQSPSTQAIQDLTESLIRNRKNEVGNAFLKLVQDNPDKDYWQVFTDDKPDTTRRIMEKNDPATGETIRQVEEAPVAMALMSDKYFATKKDGKTYYIKLHDERLMKAMKNMGPETVGTTLRAFGSINRFLSSVNTMYNPVFLVTNFARDLQTAVMSIYGEQGRSDGLLVGKKMSALRVALDSPAAMMAVYDSLRGNQRSGKAGEWQKLWKEFVEDGAKTGWFRINDLEGRMKEMDRLVAQAKGGWQGQSIQSWHAFFKLIEDGNNAVENALRLSAYKHGRDAGMSRQQAASLAKNLTVNFNRRGELGTVLNSLYMFANASTQGTANMIRALGRLEGNGPLLQRLRWSNLNRTQKLSLAAVGAGYLLASLNRAGAGQDEDGVNWYDKVPDYVKEHNLVVMKSLFGGKQGEYWTFPLPYGYNMLYMLGGTVEGVASGNLKPTKAAGNIVGGMLGAFNPLGSEDSKTLTGTLLKNLSPTLPRAFIDYAMNENFMGTQIRRENAPWGTPKPDSTLGRRSTPEAYKSFVNWLNTATGGSQYRSGAVDINPDTLKYWIDYISGGTGRFIGQTVDAAAKSYNGIDIPPQQIPFLGKISGKVMPYADQQAMYEHIDELRQYDAELKTLRGADRTAFLNKYRGQISMNGIIHQSQIQLKNLRKQRDEIYSDPTLTARQQANRVLMVEQNMKKVVDRFNREYREKVGN